MPILPIILVFGAGVAMFAVAAAAKSSGDDKPTIKHGVEYGPLCSTIKVVDMAAFSKFLEGRQGQLEALNKATTATTPAIDVLIATMKIMMPGPGCAWASPDFDTSIMDPTGGDSVRWKDIRNQLSNMTIMQALEAGMFDAMDGLQAASTPAASVYKKLLDTIT